MKTYEKLRSRPMALVLVAVGLALLLVTVLSLSLSARAEPMDDDLEVNKQVNTDKAGPGDTLTYTIHITNNVPSNFALLMTDTLPPEVDYIVDSLQVIPPGTGSAGVAGDVLTWTVDSFGWHAEVIVIYSAKISSAITSAIITNTAEVTGTGVLVSSNMVSTGVSPGELNVLKTIDSSSVRPGDQVAYTVYISNTGYGAVDPFSMTDSLPSELINVGAPSITGGTGASCGEEGSVVTCTGQLDSLEMVTITFSADVSPTLEANTYFTNTVTVTGAGLPISDSVAAMVRTDYEYWFPVMLLNYPPIPVIDPIPALQEIYTVTWDCGTCGALADHFVLQEATDAGFTQNVTAYTLTQTFLPMDKSGNYGVFYYRVRADDGWGQGPWSNVEMANIAPPEVVLDPFPVPDVGVQSYWVTWDCGGCETAVDQFVIQESTGDDFTSDVVEYVATGTSLFVDNTGIMDNLYYRVRADGGWGQGPWSNVEMVDIPFYDDFEDSDSGWYDEEGVMYIDNNGQRREWKRDYKNDQYRLLVEQGGPLAWFWHPAAWAPYKPSSDKYCIETEVKFEEGNYWANMGVIFGSEDDDEDMMKIYAFCFGRDDEPGLGWFLMHKDNYQFPSEDAKERGGCSQPTGDTIQGFAPDGQNVRDGTSKEGWNRLRLGVDGNYVRVYIGDYYKGRQRMSGLSNMKYVGVIGGDYELTPIDIRYEYFQVIPESNCDY